MDHQGKETCAITPTPIIYESDHISFFGDSTIASALNFVFNIFYLTQKKKIVLGENSKNSKKQISKYEISIIIIVIIIATTIILICQISGSAGPYNKK